MAIEHLTINTWSYASISMKNEAIENQIGKAQIAVKHMADAYKKGLIRGEAGQFGSIADAEMKADFILKIEGLIPDQEADQHAHI